MLEKRTFDAWKAGDPVARERAWKDLWNTNSKAVQGYLVCTGSDPKLAEQFMTDSFPTTMVGVEASIRTGDLDWLVNHACPEAAFNKAVRDRWIRNAITVRRAWKVEAQMPVGYGGEDEERTEVDFPSAGPDLMITTNSRQVLECIIERLAARIAYEQATRQHVVRLTIVYVKWQIASVDDIADADISELREIANTSASELLDGADVARVRFDGRELRQFLVRMLFPPTDDPGEAKKSRNNLDQVIGRLKPVISKIVAECTGCAE